MAGAQQKVRTRPKINKSFFGRAQLGFFPQPAHQFLIG
jgi:hypothetical protein